MYFLFSVVAIISGSIKVFQSLLVVCHLLYFKDFSLSNRLTKSNRYRKAFCQRFFFFLFPLHNHQLSNIVKYPICFLPFTSLGFFRLENHFYMFWPWRPRELAVLQMTAFLGCDIHSDCLYFSSLSLMGTLKP